MLGDMRGYVRVGRLVVGCVVACAVGLACGLQPPSSGPRDVVPPSDRSSSPFPENSSAAQPPAQPPAGAVGGVDVPASSPRTILSGQVELARLVDLASQRLNVRVEYDPAALKAAVSVRAPAEGLTDADLWSMMNASLASRGLTTVRSTGDGAFAVVKLAEAAGAVTPDGPFPDNQIQWSQPEPGYASVFLRPQRRTPKGLIDPLKSVLSKTGSAISVVGDSDLIAVSDLTPRLRAAVRMLERLDVAESPTEVVEIVLERASAAEVAAFAKELSARRDGGMTKPVGEVLAQPGGGSGGGGGGNAVTIVAPREHVQFWKDLVARLDKGQEVDTRTYTPRSAAPAALAKLIEQTVHDARRGADESAWKLVEDELTGSLIITATSAQHAQVAALLERVDGVSSGPATQARTYVIRNRPVRELLGVLTKLITDELPASNELLPEDHTPVPPPQARRAPGSGGSTIGAGPGMGVGDRYRPRPRLTADEGTNSIIAVAEPPVLARIESLLRTLDVRQPQVMIEVLMASLSEGQSLALGVELDRMGSLDGSAVRLTSIFSATASAAGISAAPGRGFTASVLNAGDFSVVLRAFEGLNGGRSVSMPRVLVGNNQQASFSSVSQQPTSSVSTNTTSTTVTSFGGFQDAGTKIGVQPQIAEGDHLLLTYNVELSSFTSTPQGGLPGARQQNSVQSVASIPDGHTVVVGGMELTTRTDDTSQVPLIGRVPLVGELFKNRTRTNDRTRFYVFIRATVLRDQGFEDLKYLSEPARAQAGIDDGWPVVEPRVIK